MRNSSAGSCEGCIAKTSLCQAGLRRAEEGSALSRPVHTSDRYLQSPALGIRRRARHPPMERLCSRRQTVQHDSNGNGVFAPFLHACAAERIRQDPVFWLSRESIPCALPPALPATAGERSHAPLHFLGNHRHLALPLLRCSDDCHPQTHRCGTFAVRLLLYLLMLPTTADYRRARRTPTGFVCLPFTKSPTCSFW